MKTCRVLVIFGVIAAANCCCGEGIELNLRTSKKVYHPGEKITFEFIFKNVSKEPLKLFPDPEIYYPNAITITARTLKGNVEEIEIGESSMDYRDWRKDVVILPFNHSYVWHLKSDFRNTLPLDWKKFLLPKWQQKIPGMPYLVFLGGSALRLPGYGEYSVIANYNFQPSHPVVEYIQGKPKLWFGKLRSNAITIDFKE